MRLLLLPLITINVLFTLPATAQAPVCGQAYAIRTGDSLSLIAEEAFGDANSWPYIYSFSDNGLVIGEDPGRIQSGTTLDMPPCPDEVAAAVGDAASPGESSPPSDNDPVMRTSAVVELLTGTDYPPFTDQGWEQGGMLTEVVDAVMAADPDQPYAIDWVNDWSAHIDPLLRQHKYDMGFPWFQPDCDRLETIAEADRPRCEFLFSDPLFDMLIVLFRRADDTTPLTSDKSLHGKRLCRPTGYFTFDLTARGLVPGDTIELAQPASVADCFHKLVDGEIDFVTINQFTGQKALNEFDYQDFVTASEDLADVLGLRLVIHKTHPQATVLIHRFNKSLDALKESGRYDEIVGRHLSLFHGLNS